MYYKFCLRRNIQVKIFNAVCSTFSEFLDLFTIEKVLHGLIEATIDNDIPCFGFSNLGVQINQNNKNKDLWKVKKKKKNSFFISIVL